MSNRFKVINLQQSAWIMLEIRVHYGKFPLQAELQQLFFPLIPLTQSIKSSDMVVHVFWS